MERPTFSQSWSRVAHLTPKLRPEVQIQRQLFRGEPWFVVHDPLSNSFFRLNSVDYHLIGLLEGKRSVDEAWRLALERFGDEAPTQNEVIGLLSQLNYSNLLRVDLPPDAASLLQRRRRRQLRHWGGQAMSILFIRIPLFNPEPVLKWLLPLFRPLLSKYGLMAWVVWLLFCGYWFLPELNRFVGELEPGRILNPTNWAWMIVLFLITKAIHELGHGLVCKRFGGVVPEMGIMMLVLFPNPFVDATSSWNFPDKWKRLLVAAAGMIFELAVSGGAALVWVFSEAETIAHQLSYNMILLASITTLLFNANPLLRFDGYYMLSDLLDIPNLYERSTRQLRRLVQRYAYGMTNVLPVSQGPTEASTLVLYGIASQIYRVLILAGIVLFIAGQLFTLGVLIAIWSIIAWCLVPLARFARWLLVSPALHGHRLRAATVTAGTVILLFGTLGLVPFEEHRRTSGVVESARRSNVIVQTDGFVEEVLVETGQVVEAGQVILRAHNPALAVQAVQRESQIAGLETVRRQSATQDYVGVKTTEQRIDLRKHQLRDIHERLDDLVIRSPQAGVLVAPLLKPLEGQWLEKGRVLGRIVDLAALRVTALVDQTQSASAFYNQIERVELRTVGNIQQKHSSRVIKKFNSGRRWLPHPALSYRGGGPVATDPADPQGQTALQPQFELWLSLLPVTRSGVDETNAGLDQPIAYPGQRVQVRFTLQSRRPLLSQWVHRLRQVIRNRLGL